MGGDTTFNENLVVANNGSSHIAMTMGPTDICKLPNNVPAPFPNFIMIKGNLLNGTTNTSIVFQPVWIQQSYLGPVSDPAHAGVNKGVVSGTYRGIAKATSWSKDVKMEGQFVVRTSDSTTQNNANTTGTVLGAAKVAQVNAEDEYKKLLCTIVAITGKCKHGRDLGPPPGAPKDSESNYLEVLIGDEIEFIAIRENVVDRTKNPKCEKGTHTRWVAKTTGQSWADTVAGIAGDGPPTEEIKETPDTYTLKGKMTGDEEESGFKEGDTKFKANDVDNFEKRERLKQPRRGQGTVPTSDLGITDQGGKYGPGGTISGKTASGDAITNSPTTVAEEKERKEINDVAKKYEQIKGIAEKLKEMMLLWDATVHPRVVTVDAGACSGKKTAKIMLLPKEKLEIDFFTEKLKAAIDKIKGWAKIVERAGNFFNMPMRIDFFKDPKLTLKLEYKELKEDKPAKMMGLLGERGPFWKVQVRRSWALEFGFNPLIGASIKFTAPLATALGPLGAVVAQIIKWCGLKGNFFLKIEIEFAPKGSIAWDEYDEIVKDVAAEVKLNFSVGIEAYAVIAEFTVYAIFEGKVTAENWGSTPGYLLSFDVKGEVQLGVAGTAKASFWGIQYSKSFEYKPDCWKFGNKDPLQVAWIATPGTGGP